MVTEAEKQMSQAEAQNDAIKDEKAETEYEKLKSQNAEFEKELIKAREMRAEMQKLEAEKVLGGDTGGHVEAKMISPEEIKTEKAKEFFKGTALGDAINKSDE